MKYTSKSFDNHPYKYYDTVCLLLSLHKTNEEPIKMEDIIRLRTRIYAFLRGCNLEETQKVLDFCSNLKPRTTSSDSTKSYLNKAALESQQARNQAQTPAPAPVQEPKQELPVNIDYLCGKWMHCVGQVAQWTYDTYFKDKRPESYEKVLAATKICYAAMLPIRLVAVNGPDCVGSMSIVKHEQSDRVLTPLLTFICVPDQYKGMGIEPKLIKQGIKVLKGLGYKEAFIKTDSSSILPTDMNWEHVVGCQDVYRCAIPTAIASY